MLRNTSGTAADPTVPSGILNEVLSLNAQEYFIALLWMQAGGLLLNEVLSLNAQESRYSATSAPRWSDPQ